MEQYILKSALVAELKKRFDYRVNGLKAIDNGTFWNEDQSEDEFNAALTRCAYNAAKNEIFELMCFVDTLEVKEVDTEQLDKLLNWWKEVTTECSAYYKVKEVDLEKEMDKEWNKCEPVDEGMGLEIASIEHEQFDNIAKHFFELGLKAAQKGDNMTKEIKEIKECDGKISSNIVTDENNWYVCIKQLNNFEVGKVYCIGKNTIITVPEYFRLATDEEISQGASMQNTDTTEPTGVRLEKCPKALKGE